MIELSKLKAHVYEVIGAIHEVHNELGAGLNEYCYQEGLQMQLDEQGITSYTCAFSLDNSIMMTLFVIKLFMLF